MAGKHVRNTAYSGSQCTSIEEVDRTVQDYWVQSVWRRHVEENATEKWAAFQASPFFSHIPQCHWPCEGWSLDRVKKVLARMDEGSAPGVRGIPLAVWKSLPDDFLKRVSDLLGLVETEGRWPQELLSAYVAMIP